MKKFTLLKAEIAKVKRYRGITNADIARMTGFKKSTIEMFMLNRSQRSDSVNVAKAITAVLNIDYPFDEESGGKDDNG